LTSFQSVSVVVVAVIASVAPFVAPSPHRQHRQRTVG
jgi:hypothetical protein